MIRSLLKVGLLLVVGFLGYNYFLGTPEEKESAKNTINKVKDVGKDLVNLGKEEIGKFKSGKYDNAIDKVSGFLQKAKSTAQEKGGNLVEQIENWEAATDEWKEQKSKLEDLLKTNTDGEASKEVTQQLKEHNKKGKELQAKGEALQSELEE